MRANAPRATPHADLAVTAAAALVAAAVTAVGFVILAAVWAGAALLMVSGVRPSRTRPPRPRAF